MLHYQPKIDLETGAMTGAEALIRWAHPERGLMFPKDFVPIAEDCGLIVPIGQWVLREACRQARAWIDEGRRPMAVAVNISAVEFRDPRFLDNVRAVLHDSRLDAALSRARADGKLPHPACRIHRPRAPGAERHWACRWRSTTSATGTRALSYLRQFPINVLKIDQSFVHEISADPVGTSIVCRRDQHGQEPRASRHRRRRGNGGAARVSPGPAAVARDRATTSAGR